MKLRVVEPVEASVIPLGNTRKTSVRLAQHEDVFAIHATLLDALAATDTPFPEPDIPYALQALMDLIAQNLIGVAVDTSGGVVGVLVLDTARWPWVSPQNRAGVHLYNQHYWVEPHYRAGGAGVKLLDWAKARADEMGLPLLIEISSLDASTESGAKDKFVASRGFKYIGGKFFRKAIR